MLSATIFLSIFEFRICIPSKQYHCKKQPVLSDRILPRFFIFSQGEDDEGDEDLEEDRDEITSLGGGETDNNKRKFGKSLPPKRPSFQKQTSRYEDRLRNEDLAVQAAYEKRKESKKLSEVTKASKTKDFQPTLEDAYDFFTKENWGPADHKPSTVKFETDESEQVIVG